MTIYKGDYMNDLALTQVTMTSLELVEFINSQRKEGEAELRHSDFLEKVVKVLGLEMSENFRSSYKDSMNRQKPCYRFPKRESCLMAMSYSYDLQAKVYDKMTALEDALKNQQPKLPTNYKEALLALVAAEEEKEALALERDHAIATKHLISDRKTATALNTASQMAKKANKLQAELGRCKEHATIIAIKNMTGIDYGWLPLRKWCKAQNVKPLEVVDARYGMVKSWPSAAWFAVYGIDLSVLFSEVA